MVDDSPHNALLTIELLLSRGFPAEIASDGIEAIAALKTTPFALVLMDCHMPNLDGYEATRLIRAGAGCDPKIAIVGMTAAATESDRDECFAAGMNDFLAKPLEREDLDAVLSRHLNTGSQIPRRRVPGL